MYRSEEQIVNQVTVVLAGRTGSTEVIVLAGRTGGTEVIVVLAGRTGGRDVPQSGADCQPGEEEDGRR